MIFFLSLVIGLSEESLFRGLLQGGLDAWLSRVFEYVPTGSELTAGTLLALVLASSVFGALHAATLTYALLAGAMGFYLGGIYIGTGNLLVPVLVHAFYDSAVMLHVLFSRGRAPYQEKETSNGE